MTVKHKDPMIEALKEGRCFTWTMPDGGDLASMRAVVKHGQTLTMSPVTDPREIQVGDIVCVRWHNGYMRHLVQEIQGDQYLIANSLGKINGWVGAGDILGRVTHIVDPEPRPSVPDILAQLEDIYRQVIERAQPETDEARRLLSVVDDLRWYADRIGVDRWDELPRQNKWSFVQNLWLLTRETKTAVTSAAIPAICDFIDQGKVCVGLVAEIITLFAQET